MKSALLIMYTNVKIIMLGFFGMLCMTNVSLAEISFIFARLLSPRVALGQK